MRRMYRYRFRYIFATREVAACWIDGSESLCSEHGREVLDMTKVRRELRLARLVDDRYELPAAQPLISDRCQR